MVSVKYKTSLVYEWFSNCWVLPFEKAPDEWVKNWLWLSRYTQSMFYRDSRFSRSNRCGIASPHRHLHQTYTGNHHSWRSKPPVSGFELITRRCQDQVLVSTDRCRNSRWQGVCSISGDNLVNRRKQERFVVFGGGFPAAKHNILSSFGRYCPPSWNTHVDKL